MKAKIIFYKQENLSQNEKFKLRRELIGLEQKSNFSRYSYQIKGILDKLPHYRPVDSSIIVGKKHMDKITSAIKKHNAVYETFSIEIPKCKLSKK